MQVCLWASHAGHGAVGSGLHSCHGVTLATESRAKEEAPWPTATEVTLASIPARDLTRPNYSSLCTGDAGRRGMLLASPLLLFKISIRFQMPSVSLSLWPWKRKGTGDITTTKQFSLDHAFLTRFLELASGLAGKTPTSHPGVWVWFLALLLSPASCNGKPWGGSSGIMGEKDLE